MFEIMIEEILKVRGQRTIAQEYGATFGMKIRKLSKLKPDQLNFRNALYSHIKSVADELELPTEFLINLLDYNKFEEEKYGTY